MTYRKRCTGFSGVLGVPQGGHSVIGPTNN